MSLDPDEECGEFAHDEGDFVQNGEALGQDPALAGGWFLAFFAIACCFGSKREVWARLERRLSWFQSQSIVACPESVRAMWRIGGGSDMLTLVEGIRSQR